ncbi:uncharacterized protein LOC108137786 [Drosophila elegans]|uniref:uncharacterized protein LOC108137786 n=1 Tax=Drosophila elegans TaxID=30023 RepID=UPI0007E6D15E|nr:uncharacterized protein LOC108137786 [Drosophila elegans]
MEPEDPYQVEGGYRPADDREGSETDSSGESQGHDSVLSTHSPTTPGLSIPSAVLDRFLGTPAPAAFQSGDESLDLQLCITGGEQLEVRQALQEDRAEDSARDTPDWIEAPEDWRVDTPDRRLPPALVASVQAQDRRRVRYLRKIDGAKFRINVTARGEVIVALRPLL